MIYRKKGVFFMPTKEISHDKIKSYFWHISWYKRFLSHLDKKDFSKLDRNDLLEFAEPLYNNKKYLPTIFNEGIFQEPVLEEKERLIKMTNYYFEIVSNEFYSRPEE